MKKELFIIQSYIPSDEDIVVCSVYKQYQLGFKNKKYIFIDILNDSGVGIEKDEFGETSKFENLVTFLKVVGFNNNEKEISEIIFCTFEEMLKIKDDQESLLKEKLK